MWIRKERVKLSLLEDDILLYLQNLDSTKKIIGITNFSKVAGYELNI